MNLSRRCWLKMAALVSAGAAWYRHGHASAVEEDLPAPIASLKDMTGDMKPIGLDERKMRITRAQQLLVESGLDAMVITPGTSLEYFTGTRWGLSERFFGLVLTRRDNPIWIAPAFETARAEEQIQIGSDIRPWEEHESPYEVIASVLRDRKIGTGRLGVEETMRFVFADGITRALPALRVESATPVTAGCRMIKDTHELDLMRRACEITVRAHRAVFASLKEGMSQSQVSQLSSAAHSKLGIGGGSLVLFGPDAAYPHGTTKPRPLRSGDLVLIDGGGKLHGYSSDITRTGVFGTTPTDRQRRIWDLVRKAQQAAFDTVRPGVECQAVDQAARKVIEDAGFGPGYRYFTHRVGHGIGMDGHEWTYLVGGNTTPLRPGMCFSNEPGVYIPGEMGVRHEDIMFVTDEGAGNMTRWSGSLEDPAVL